MLNCRSSYLVILVATYNRLPLLKKALEAIARGTRCCHEIIVIDGGSTDGTIDYLTSHSGVTPVLQGKLLGAALAYNQVWKEIDSRYTCWLSDDTEIVQGSLDLAVEILESNPQIGMVGLKMKDTEGSGQNKPYMGAISEYGIINCNHGVLPTHLLHSVGYFNQSYHSYGIDPDLTASILSTGKQVVMTKEVSVLHHRVWWGENEKKIEVNPRKTWKSIYRQKFHFLDNRVRPYAYIKAGLNRGLTPILFPRREENWQTTRFGISYRDWRNIMNGRFVSPFDGIENLFHPYHLVQKIPSHLLLSEDNPYRQLVGK